MNKTHPRIFAILLAVCLVLPLTEALSGCRKKTEEGSSPTQAMRDPATGEVEPITGTTSLTGIYRPAETYGFEGERLSSSSYPLYDEETGSLTAFSTFEDTVPMTDENGDPVYILPGVQGLELADRTTLRTLLPDGTCTNSYELPMPEGHRLYKGGISEYGVWYISYDMSAALNDPERYALNRMEPDGKEHRSVFLPEIFANPTDANTLTRTDIAPFSDGTLAAGLGLEIAVLDRDLGRLYSVAADGEVEKLSACEDGGIWILTGPSSMRKIWTLDAGKDRPVLFADLNGSTDQIFFGPGADYYGFDRKGIYAVRDGESVYLMDRQNSGLTGTVFPVEAAASEVFVLDVITDSEEAEKTVSLYRRAEDIDLSTVKVIEIATTLFSIPQEMELKISKYNREHPETRVVVTQAVDGDVPFEERFDRLCFSLANGFYKPDIILAINNANPPKLFDTVLAKHLYRDLTPFLEKDPDVRLDDLFGMVRSYFTDRDGGLWGISPTFYFRALTGRSDVLGQTAQKGSWTLDETLGFLESRPKGTVGIENLTQENWTTFLLGPEGFGRWIDYDAGTCRFDRADFGRMLRYLKTLPKDYDEFMRRAGFWAGMSADERYSDYAPYRDGTIALQSAWYQSVYGVCELKDRFGTTEKGSPDLVCVGYPSDDGNDALRFTAQNVCIITSFCSDPDAAWELIRTFFDDPVGYGGVSGDAMAVLYADAFPALRSAYDRQAEVLGQYYMTQVKEPGNSYWSVTMQLLPADGSAPVQPKNGRAIVFDRELTDGIRSLLDGASVTPYVNCTPPEIEEIVFEEVSAYLAGGSDADQCVKYIQSRVSVRLAENR